MGIKLRTLLAGGLAATLALHVQACSSDPSGPGEGESRIQILVTDAPSDYIAEAVIWVSHVYLQGGGEDNAPRVDLFNDPENPVSFDLLELQDGVTADLTPPVDVDASTYRQLRIIVDSARVTLIDGMTFNDGTTSKLLFVPSGSQSGIKVTLLAAIEADEGEETTLVVDFDVDQNFVIQGNPETPAGINGILFTPVLRELRREDSSA